MQCNAYVIFALEMKKSKSTIYEEKSIFTYVKITVEKDGKFYFLDIVVNWTYEVNQTIKHYLELKTALVYFSSPCENISMLWQYSQTCVQRPPLEPKNSGRCWQVGVVQRSFM